MFLENTGEDYTYQKAKKVTRSDKFLAATFLKLLPSWVTPNHLTIFRFLSIPFVLLLLVGEEYIFAMILFVISAFSDALDGALARTQDKITNWGKLFDPLADKLLIGTTAVILIPKFLSIWLAFSIIFIELVIVLGAYYKKRYQGVTVQSEKFGKIKMIFQSVGVSILFVYMIFPISILLLTAQYVLYAAVAFAFVQMLIYKSV
jgi:CDP-diacylglycerol--glycerol-3-phosphate 3-phosphatidyltransferase